MAYDPNHQTGENGALAPALRQRIETVKDKLNLTLADLGQEFEFSGPFMSSLLRPKNPGHVRTKHIGRMIQALERLEVRAGLRAAPAGAQATASAAAPANLQQALVDLIRAAHKLGFEVSFKPLRA